MILRNGEALDRVSARFGCRSFEIHPERGFILNGREYPLRGVSRHQDRWGIGNALLKEHHLEDMDLICEVGANTIRLAHYQHDQYFYDLCDERGMVVWAEIPYISRHMPDANGNTVSQMKELITQCYNHPSIVVWGLSNEITMDGAKDPDMIHLCGKRYIDRVEDVTKVTVYSNLPQVELFANGVSLGKKSAEDHFFYFDVPNSGETKLEAVAGGLRDESVIRKVDTMNPDYILREQGAVLNWFDITEIEGRHSLNSKLGEVAKTLRGKLWFAGLFLTLAKKMRAAAPKSDGKKKKKGKNPDMIADVMKMIGGFTVLRFT